MTLYEKIKKLEITLSNDKTLVLDKIEGQNRIIKDVRKGNIVYTHKIGGSDSYFNIDVFYKTYLILKDLGELSSNQIRNIDISYTDKRRPCNVVTFMLLMEYFFGCKIKGNGVAHDPYIVVW